MKNIHLIPTDKPSRLVYLTKKGKEVFNDLRLFEKPMPNILDSENQNIYIINDEEIKEGDWVITNNGLLAKVITEFTWHFINSKKIILTLIFTALSIARSYVIRRFFNKKTIKEVNQEVLNLNKI